MGKEYPCIAKITRSSISGIYPRKRLFKMLGNSRNPPVTWISAPAGAGKTALAASYLDAHGLPCLWYNVDTGDADIATFFYYMGLAAKKTSPGFRKPLPLLTPDYLLGISVFARRYFAELYRRLKPPFVIVLDNYQEAPAESGFHEIINIGLSTLPEGIKVIVLSRNEPPPAFIRLRAGMINSLEWSDIRLTEDESRNIVRLKEKRKLDAATLSMLHRKTEGWVAGLILLIESAKSDNIDYRLLERLTPREIFDYFATEIFRMADGETREFLLKTAFLPAMTVQMAEALTGIKTAGRILSGLNRNNFFFEKHPKTYPFYTCHPLFREFLLSRAKETFTTVEIAEIRCTASLLLMEAGQSEAAARLLIDAEEWGRFVPFALTHAQPLMAQGRRETLNDWLTAIPREIAENTPWLLYWLGVCEFGFIPTAEHRYFEKAFHLFEAHGDDVGALLAWSGAVNKIFFDFDNLGLFDKWIDWLDEHAEEGIVFPSREVEASVASSMANALINRKPNHPDIKKWVGKALSLSSDGLSIDACVPYYPFFANYYLLMGEFGDCAMVVDGMRNMVRDHTVSPVMTITLKFIEALFYNTSMDFREKGLKSVMEGLEKARETGAHLLDPLLFAAGVYSSLHVGDMKSARGFLEEMAKTLRSNSKGQSCFFCYLSAWCNLCEGNAPMAVVFAKKSTQLAEEAGLTLPESLARVVLALALHETGDCPEAGKQLASIRVIAMQTRSALLEYLYNLLSAHFAFARKADAAGLEALARSMALGRQKGFASMMNFWRPSIMSSLCAKALEAGIEVDYVQGIVRKLKLMPDFSAIEVENWPWPVQIFTLGRFEIRKDGARLQFPAKAPHRLLLLLKALIACGPRGASVGQLADLLWPDADGDTALQALDTSLHRLRKLLGNDEAIRCNEGRIGIETGCCLIDAHAFENLLGQAEERITPTVNSGNMRGEEMREGARLIERAVKLYRGPFLDGSPEPWALSYRERLRNRFLQAVTGLGNYSEREGLFTDAVGWYEKGLEMDDCAEQFYCGLMRCYLAQGRKSEAIAVYRSCKKNLENVFGVAPCHEMEALLKTASLCY